MMGKNKTAILLMLLCAGVFFYLFSCEVPYYSDDWWYAWVQEQEGYPTQRIVTLCDVAVSQYNHYMSVNSRVFVNGLVQVVVSFCSKIRRKHNRRAQYVLYAGFLAGVLFLLLAPCMFLRLSGQVGGYGLVLTGLYLPGLLLPVLLASVWVWLYVRHRRWALRCMRRCRVAIVAAAVSLLIAMAADNGEHRAYWCPSFFCAIPLTYLWSLLWQRAAKRRRVAAVVLSSLLLLFACLVYREHCRVEAQHRELIDTFRKSADGTVVMEIYTPPLYAYGYTLDLRREYLKGWTAWHMKSYYGRPMLNFIPSSLYKALSHPDTFFAEPHRVPGNACLYTLPDIDVYVWPAKPHAQDFVAGELSRQRSVAIVPYGMYDARWQKLPMRSQEYLQKSIANRPLW